MASTFWAKPKVRGRFPLPDENRMEKRESGVERLVIFRKTELKREEKWGKQ